MKKKLVVVLMLTLLLVTACDRSEKAEEKKNNDTKTIESSKINTEETQVEKETAEEKNKQEENKQAEDKQDELADCYLEFLSGENQLFFYNNSSENDYDSVNDYFESGKGYTLSEITNVLKTGYNLEKDPVVKYAEMDCGNDCEKEIALLFEGMNIYSPDDSSTVVFIIKEIDGKLKSCYSYETWARSGSVMNYYGYYTSYGSNGASNHGSSSGYVDAKGNWNFINYTEEEQNIEQLSWSETLGRIPKVAETKTYDGSIVFYSTNFDEIKSSDDYEYMERFYSFDVIEPEYSKDDLYTTSVYKDIFDEAGVTVYSPDEIDKMIKQKEEKVGVTEEIKNGAELQFITLE